MTRNYVKKVLAFVVSLTLALSVLGGISISSFAATEIETSLSFYKDGVATTEFEPGDTVEVVVSLTNYTAAVASSMPISALQINIGVNTDYVTVSNVATLLTGAAFGDTAASYISSDATVTYADIFMNDDGSDYEALSGSDSAIEVMSFDAKLSDDAAEKRISFAVETIATDGTSTTAYAANDGTVSFICGGEAAYSAPSTIGFSAFAELYGVTNLGLEVDPSAVFEGSNDDHPYAHLKGIGQANTSADNLYSVSTDASVYTVGDAINVTTYGQASNDWVAIYAFGDILNTSVGGIESIYWIYLGDMSGDTIDITDTTKVTSGPRADAEEVYADGLTAGFYTIHLLKEDSYESMAAVTIQIVDSGESTDTGYSISTDKFNYEIGESIYVTTTASGTNDWIGLYEVGEDYGSDDGCVPSIYWYYVSGTQTVDLTDTSVVSENTADGGDRTEYQSGLLAGDYMILLFSADSYELEAAAEITIAEPGDSDYDANTMVEPFAGLTNLDSSYTDGVLFSQANAYAYIGSYDFTTVDTVTVTYSTTGGFDDSASEIALLKGTDAGTTYVTADITATGGYKLTNTVELDVTAAYSGPIYLAISGEESGVYVTSVSFTLGASNSEEGEEEGGDDTATYSITVTIPTGTAYGTGSVTVVSTATAGETVSFTTTAEDTSAGLSSVCTAISSDDVTITATTAATGAYTGGSFTMPAADVEITVNFRILGDVMYNGTINNIDAMLIRNYYNGSYTLNAEQLISSNVVGSTSATVNNLDAMYVLNYYNGKVTSFPNA